MNRLDKLNYFLIVSILILSFSKGALELLGFSETILQLLIEFLILILFSFALLFIFKRKKIRGPGIFINFLLLAVILLSFLLTNGSILLLVLYLRKLFVYYLFFYALFNINLTQVYRDKILKLIIVLFLIQIPAAFIKLVVLGGTLEKIVGSMSVSEGSLATIMPLFAITYLIVNYLEFRKIKYIVFILLFISIGLISNKMGILYYIVLMYLVLSVIHSNSKYFLPNLKLLREFFIGTIFLSIIFAMFVSLNPRANPEHKVGGSIDFQYLKDWTIHYQTVKLDTKVEGDGRFDAPSVALDRMSSGGIINLLLGFGPGEIIQSSFTPYNNPLLEKYNIGYGGRLGFVWSLMQIGLIGTAILLFFHLLLFKKIFILYNSLSSFTEKRVRILILTTLGFSIIYFLDFFTYSAEMLYSPGVVITYFFAFYYILIITKALD